MQESRRTENNSSLRRVSTESTVTMRYPYYTSLRWFRITVGFGFLLNMLFILPALFAPRLLESLVEVGTTNTVHWLQNVGILLAIVTLMYIPAIWDPFRYLFISFLLVGGRFSAGLLFLLGVLSMNYPARDVGTFTQRPRAFHDTSISACGNVARW